MNNEQTELLEAVFQADPGALAVISGADLVFRAANPAYRALVPGQPGDLVGQPYCNVWQAGSDGSGPDGKDHRESAAGDIAGLIRKVIETGQPADVDAQVVEYADGTRRIVSFRIRPLSWQGEPGALQVIWDLTGREMARAQAQQADEAALRRAAELNAVLDALPDSVVIYDEAAQVSAANRAAEDILGFNPVSMSREAILANLSVHLLDGRSALPSDLPAFRALKGQRVRSQRLVVKDHMGRQIQVLASGAPLHSGDQLVGAVTVWSDVSELIQRRQELEALVQVAGALRNTIVQEEMFPAAINQVVELMKADGASILMPDPATGELVVRAGAGAWTSTVGQRLQPGSGVSYQVLASGEHYLNNQIQQDERLVRSVFMGDQACGACVPLKVQDSTIGVLWLGRNQPITGEEVHFLSAIADMAASGLYRARLFEQTQLRLRRLSGLHIIDMAITSSLDLQLTLSVLLDQVVSQMRIDAADILLFDPALHWLEFASGRGFIMPDTRAEPHHLGETPAGQVALERHPLVIPDLSHSEIPAELWLSAQEGFRAYFAAPLISKGQVKGVLELFHREVFHPDAEWLEFLDTLATQAAIALDSAELFSRLQRSNDELTQAYDATIEGWSHALELRDRETEGHSRRVTEMTIRLARRLGISDEEIAHYRRGVLLHDIGKMAIPDAILLKDGPLTPEEQEIMRMHPIYAYDLLKPIAYLRPALDIPYCHHEWWDGRGYPRGLKGEEIPLAARIFTVIDVYDALTNKRTYRPPWPEQKVMEYIRSRAGTQFDPRIVDEFLKMNQGFGRSSRFHSLP